ncbi:DUF6114 domain-containing protein [Amycolatopsis sp. NPDC058986]|uniref:DUF6114 domain-containing protein n=1 Tax=unclassified Amycolatopsis TaxID=2618356 RepID=UPI00366B247D
MRVTTGRAAFARWRRGRPFGAGVFTAAAGLAIGIPPYASLRLGDVYVAISTFGGVSSLLVGVLLLLGAGALWLRPQFRFVTGVATLLLSLTALVTANLGGFLIGTGCGVLGAALAIGWTRAAAAALILAVVPVLALSPIRAEAQPSSPPSSMTARQLKLDKPKFEGQVGAALRFTARGITATGLVLESDRIVLRAAARTTIGGDRTTLLVERLSGTLFGQSFTATPRDPGIVRLLSLGFPGTLTIDDVVATNVQLRNGDLTMPGLALSTSSPPKGQR